MAWIESHHTLRNHPKVFKLCKELNVSRPAAIGHLHCLWWWTIENRESGDLTGLFDKDIAIACDWDKNPQKLVRALKKCGWITADMHIHDWMKYAGRLIHERAKYRRRTGKHTGDRTGDTRVIPGESPATPNLTLPNHTVPLKEKNGFLFLDEDKKRIEKRLKEVRGYAPEAMATGLAIIEFQKIITEKKPKDPVAYIMGILNKEAEAK